jgi:hypothetical protein
MPAGRPTKYDPAMCETVIHLGVLGKSRCQIAASLGVAMSTLQLWEKQHSAFSAALQESRDLSQCWWEDEAQKSLHDPTMQTGLWYANMKNRFGWRDKTESTVDATVQVSEIVRKIVDPGNPDS